MTRTDWLRRAGLVVAVGLVPLGCAVTPAQAPAPDQVPRTIDAAGYRMDTSPGAVVDFPLTRTVFAGEVIGQDPAVHATDVVAGGANLDVVYTPVRVRVTRTFRGDVAAGDEITLRIMGGTADGVTYATDDAPALTDLPAGASLLVWGSSASRVGGEPAPAITPYFVYRRGAGAYSDVTYAGEPASRVPARRLVQRVEAASTAWRKEQR